MKVKPVMDALEAAGVDVVLVHTGQHYDASMSEVFLTELGIRPPDRWLEVGSGSHGWQTGRIMAAFEPVVAEVAPVPDHFSTTRRGAIFRGPTSEELRNVGTGSRAWAAR